MSIEASGFIARELARIEAAIIAAPVDSGRWHELHAAQQALKWTTEPQGYAAPLDSIDGVAGQAATGTLGVPADCLAGSHPARS